MSIAARKSGYQLTTIGWIPSSWQVVSLADVTRECKSRNNGQLDEKFLCGVIKLHGLVAMRDRVKGVSTERCKIVDPNAFAYNPMRLNIGSIARNKKDHKVMVSPDYIVFKGDPKIIAPNYLDQLRNSKLWQDHVTSAGDGSVRIRIYYDQLARLKIPLPPIAEQEKIAEILDTFDKKLNIISRQISATLDLKAGLMHRLFTRGFGMHTAECQWKDHCDFKDSVLGEIPVGWEMGSLSDYISSLRSGVSVNAEDRPCGENEIGVLKVSCVLNGDFRPHENKTILEHESSRASEPVLKGRIIISRANTPTLVGESAYIDSSYPDLFLPDKLWQTEPSKNPHSARWLAFYLQSPFVRQEIKKEATGTSGSMKNISKQSFLGIPMPLVPIAEQDKIADILSTVKTKLNLLAKKQDYYKSLKLGLMQKLLTGELRVKLETTAET